MEKSCRHCGTRFTTSEMRRKYCSFKCAIAVMYGENEVASLILKEIEDTGKSRILLKGIFDRLKTSCEG